MKTNQNDDQQGRSAAGVWIRRVSTKLKRNKKAGESERVKHRWTSKETVQGHYRPGLPFLHQMGKIEATAILVIFGWIWWKLPQRKGNAAGIKIGKLLAEPQFILLQLCVILHRWTWSENVPQTHMCTSKLCWKPNNDFQLCDFLKRVRTSQSTFVLYFHSFILLIGYLNISISASHHYLCHPPGLPQQRSVVVEDC